MSVSDFIKDSMMEFFQTGLTVGSVVSAIARLLVALAIGFVIYLLYKASFRGVVYSESFAMSLVGMTLVTSAMLVAISSNLVLSLGCVGALSIVRYRTAIKSPMDLMFLFLCVGVGVCIGAGMIHIAVIVVALFALLLLIMAKSRSNEELYVLIIHYTGADITEKIQSILGDTKYKIQSTTIRKNDVEMAVEVRVKNKNLAFTEDISALENVNDMTVVQYNGDYIG